MKRFDENDVAKRLGARTPPPPPDLAARIKRDIPEQVEVPPGLTAPRGTLPLVGRLVVRQRVLALAATLLVVVAAGLVARRVLRPAAGRFEVALIGTAPAPHDAAVPTAAAALPAAAPPETTAVPPAPEPLAKQAAVAAARTDAGKGGREAASDAMAPAPAAPAQPQVMAQQAVAEVAPAGPAVVGGVLAPTTDEADEEPVTPQAEFVEARSRPRLETQAEAASPGNGRATGESPAVGPVAARQAGAAAAGPGPEPALAPAPSGDALLLLVPAGAVVTFEPSAVARYRPLAVSGTGAVSIVEVIAQEGLESASGLLTVAVRPDKGPAPAAGAVVVLRPADIAASFRAAPRALRAAYLEARLTNAPPAGGEEAATLFDEAAALAAEDPADEAARTLRGRWEAAFAGLPPPPR